MIKGTNKEISQIKFERPKSSSNLGFEFYNFDQYLLKHIKSTHATDEDCSNEWKCFFVGMTEYMVNPAVKKKNFIVLDFLANTYIP